VTAGMKNFSFVVRFFRIMFGINSVVRLINNYNGCHCETRAFFPACPEPGRRMAISSFARKIINDEMDYFSNGFMNLENYSIKE
jgi:hypothetical protein